MPEGVSKQQSVLTMMPPQSSPLHVANLAQQMAQKAEGVDAKLFQKVALVSMGVMAIGSVAQVALEIMKKRCPNYDRDECSRRSRS
jgi:hypothetical protein